MSNPQPNDESARQPDPAPTIAANFGDRSGRGGAVAADRTPVVPAMDTPSLGTQHRQHTVGERPGDMVGLYRLVDRLGEGGFGVVWLAEQTAPVRRRVALKIIKPGMDTAAVIARFEAERQALAVMDHPHIAKVLDGGATPMGRPYFAMEFVAGVPITKHCDDLRLTIEQRLELFADVCEAVFHAHTKGLIHRDLKPSNILVGMREEGAFEPKIIDFGVAKAMEQRLTDSTLQTEAGVLIGTPEYMSPEQAEPGVVDIDTRADVYSLGVVLYELLAGALPFDTKSMRLGNVEQMRRFIRDAEPLRPGDLVTRLGDSAEVLAKARKTRTQELTRTLRGELEWIPLKAMRKDRAERYRSAAEMADDIRNYLAGRPLIAGPVSTAYRLNKFLMRNMAGVVVAGAFVALVIAGVVWLSMAYREADAQRRRVELSLDFVKSIFKSIDPAVAQGREVTVRELLDNAVKSAAMLPAGAADTDPESAAVINDTLASAYSQLGDYRTAESLWQKAVVASEKAHGAESDITTRLRSDLLGATLDSGKAKEADAIAQQVLALRRAALGDEHPLTLQTRSVQVRIQQELGDMVGAEKTAREVAGLQARVVGESAKETLETRCNIVDLLTQQGRFAEAEKEAATIVALSTAAHGVGDAMTLSALGLQASALQETARRGEAVPILERLIAARRTINGPDHPTTLLAMNTLSLLLGDLRRDDESLAMARTVYDAANAKLGADHPATSAYLNNLGQALVRSGKLDEAERVFREDLANQRRLRGPMSKEVMTSLTNLGLMLLYDRKKPDEALPLLKQALDGLTATMPAGHWMIAAETGYVGECLQALGQMAEAEATLLKGYTLLVQSVGADNPRALRAASTIAGFYEATGKPAETADWKSKAEMKPK